MLILPEFPRLPSALTRAAETAVPFHIPAGHCGCLHDPVAIKVSAEANPSARQNTIQPGTAQTQNAAP